MVWVKMTYFHHFFRTIPGVLIKVLLADYCDCANTLHAIKSECTQNIGKHVLGQIDSGYFLVQYFMEEETHNHVPKEKSLVQNYGQT